MKWILFFLLIFSVTASASDFSVNYYIKNQSNDSETYTSYVQFGDEYGYSVWVCDNADMSLNCVQGNSGFIFGGAHHFEFSLGSSTSITKYFQAHRESLDQRYYVRESNQVLFPWISNSSVDALTMQRSELVNCSFFYSLGLEPCKNIKRNIFLDDAAPQSDIQMNIGDYFPACSSTNTGKDIDTVRCACEFLVPNLHISAIFNLLIKSLTSLLSVSTLLTGIVSFSPGGVMDYFIDIIWPLFLALFLLIFEYLKDYVMFAAAYLSWMAFISEASNRESMRNSPGSLAAFTCVAILLGSLWLLGADAGLWEPLVVF
jgi:hypothetical protein